LPEHHAHHALPVGAERHANANLAGATGHGECRDAIHADARKQERQQTQRPRDRRRQPLREQAEIG
jgi:hypothetical protein